MSKLKRKDLVKFQTGAICTVLKTYVNEENQMYQCDCGSSTFTPLNIDLESLENINY
ncbi:hypothetical protein H8923_14430 [Romboutsia hominis]|uniref:Uncharacterized protein n=1 Tax=Romboutsia faecis TaxID=2764597 RepID=A0ABR7JTJ6_9FIRM|nr:hypothetical protein [Romboutsia faecis]MBC5997956.1 hypothetical protein [Romboutsia faecis]